MSTWRFTQLLSNGGNVHIARKCDLTALLAAADSGLVEVFGVFLKYPTWVVNANKKGSELLKAADRKSHVLVDVVLELLKIGVHVKSQRNMVERLSSQQPRTDIWRCCVSC
jgi:hypothetical protein